VINKPPWGDAKLSERRKTGPRDGFQSTDHRLAGVFVWRFQTQALPSASSSKSAKAVSVSPASGSQVPFRTFVEIQFDQPMSSRVNHVWRTRFFYDAINQPLPKEAFAMPQIDGLTETLPDALDAGYTNRFVIISDGSDGSISLRWGKQGPQGTGSSGLN
jgi:hypothetical protein